MARRPAKVRLQFGSNWKRPLPARCPRNSRDAPAAPAITPIYGSEFVNGDTSSVVSGTSCTSAWAVTTPTTATPRSYCQSATAANYQFTYVDGSVTRWLQQVTDFFVQAGNIANPLSAAQYFDPKPYLEVVKG